MAADLPPAGSAAASADRAPDPDAAPVPNPALFGRTAAETRLLLLAPTPRDAEAAERFLAAAGFAAARRHDVADLVAAVAGGAGAVLVAEEALASADGRLAAALAGQPVWSDLPIIVLSTGGRESAAAAAALPLVAAANVTVVERPVRVSTLVSVVRSALRARERQYQVRDQFAAQQRDREAIRASEERFRAAFDQTAVGMVLTDLDGRVVRANDGFGRIVGRPVADLLGRDSSAYTHPDDVARNTDMLGRTRAAAAPPEGTAYEKRYVRPDGRVAYAEVNLSPVRDDAGAVNGLIAVVEDVTARREAERALAEARRRSDAALLAGSVGTYFWDVAADRVYGDANFVPLFGVPLGPDGSAPVGSFLAAIHLDDRPAVIASITRTLANPDAPFEREYRVRASGGTAAPDEALAAGGGWRWVLAKGRVERAADGRPGGWAGVVVDITDRKAAEAALRASEERYRGLFESIDQGFCILDVIFDPAGRAVDYRFVETNPAFAAQTGLTGAVGRTARELVPDLEAHWFEVYGRVATTGEPARFQNGSAEMGRWFDVYAYRVGGADSRRVALLFKDITADKRAAEAKERLLEREKAARAQAEASQAQAESTAAEAERVSRMKDEFLATLSHELRTPLNAILGWSQILLRAGDLPPEVVDGLDVIRRNAKAQAQIIEDLLDMSRIISGKIRLDVQPVDLSAIVRAAVETGRPAADAKGVRLSAVVDPLHGSTVSGDANRLQQVLWNLIANAVKFTPKGGRVQVLLGRVNSHAEVSVTDSGEGIDPAFLPHVFERFRQQDAGTARRHGGLGLGLSIVKQLVELHGGTVRAASGGPGQGSTFAVALPLTAVRQDPAGRTDRSADRTRHPRSGGDGYGGSDGAGGGVNGRAALSELRGRLGGVRVLVVDDEPDAREMVRRVLEACDATVLTAGSADDAIAQLTADRPDVLVSDIGMPGEDGYALIRRVRALSPDRGGGVPAVALTAYARSEDRVRAVLAGFQMHVPKPVEPTELVATVASLAGRVPG